MYWYRATLALVSFLLLATVAYDAEAEILIRFDQEQYLVDGPDAVVPVKILLDADADTSAMDQLESGLSSFGVRIDFDSSRASFHGAGDIAAAPELDFFGFADGAYERFGPGFGAVKGNVDSLSPSLVPYPGSVLAEFSLTNLEPGPASYPLHLGLFRTLGDSEQIFLDGNGTVLDDQLSFAAAKVVVGAAPMLQAGDADQDLDFDQFDLVKVQVAAKYLTSRPATWGEGDWNGAPGGSPGNPPPGDGLFNPLDIVAALQAGVYLTGPYAAIRPNGDTGDSQTSVVYDAVSGELSIDAPAGLELTSANIESASGIFTGDPAQNLGGSFDNDADTNIFKATFGSSFGSISFGNVAQAGLAEEFLLADLTVVGSLAGGGGLGDVDLVYLPVPEPSTVVLLCLGLVAAGITVRVRSSA